MKEIHCSNCNRFLMKASYGEFEIKCRCKTINKIKLVTYRSLLTAKPQQAILKS